MSFMSVIMWQQTAHKCEIFKQNTLISTSLWFYFWYSLHLKQTLTYFQRFGRSSFCQPTSRLFPFPHHAIVIKWHWGTRIIQPFVIAVLGKKQVFNSRNNVWSIEQEGGRSKVRYCYITVLVLRNTFILHQHLEAF